MASSSSNKNVRVGRSQMEFDQLKAKQELAKQLHEEGVIERFDKEGIKLYLISIGPAPRGKEFCSLTGFPEDRMLADPESTTYAALGLTKSAAATFFNPETPKAIWSRIQRDGAKTLVDVLKKWLPAPGRKGGFWIPPQNDQALQQGGTFIFEGHTCVWRYLDPATSAHVTPEQLTQAVLYDKLAAS